MCIILSCAPYARPTRDLLRNCWDANSDGAGLMYPDGTQWVHISKGYFAFEEYADAIDAVPAQLPLVLHMRIGTSGGYGAGVTHPFPVTDQLDILHAEDSRATYAIAHNGVLHGYATDDAAGISDTVAFVMHDVSRIANDASTLAQGGLAESNAAKKELADLTYGSRLAVMDYTGRVRLIGSGWRTAAKGIQASNDSYEWVSYYARRSITQWDMYDAFDVDPCDLVAVALDDYGCGGCAYFATCAQYGPACDDIYDYAEALRAEKEDFTEWERDGESRLALTY